MAHKILSALFSLLIVLVFHGNSGSYVAIEGETEFSTEKNTKLAIKGQLNKFKWQDQGPFVESAAHTQTSLLHRKIISSITTGFPPSDLSFFSSLASTLYKTGPPSHPLS